MTTSYSDVIAALGARLDADDAATQKDAIKTEIIELYRTVDQQITDLSAAKEAIKALIDRWKMLQAGTSLTPEFSAEKPVLHADHIGASTFVEKGWNLLSLGDYAGAEQSLTRAVELSPNDPNSEALLGWAMMLQEKHDDALMWFQKVLVREPKNSLARINVGYICLKKKIFGEAIEHLSRAIRLNNDKRATLYAHFYLGLVYLERDMFRDAQKFFQETIQLAPNFVQAFYELGRALSLNGQYAEAKDAWRAGYAANKFNPWGKRCAEALAALESQVTAAV
jgi:tetratricopeptide (TPR) repeat protein